MHYSTRTPDEDYMGHVGSVPPRYRQPHCSSKTCFLRNRAHGLDNVLPDYRFLLLHRHHLDLYHLSEGRLISSRGSR